MEKIHITPINDLKKHEDSVNCHCKPKTEYINDTLLIIHNSYDKRENLEKAQRQNLEDLKVLYSKNKITKPEIEELLNESVEDEEYEVAVSIRDFLNGL
jgi:protein-arginine kinase activator protein McsA